MTLTDARPHPLKSEAMDSDRKWRIGIIQSSWNFEIIEKLTKICANRLGVLGCHIEFIKTVPGAYELPLAAKLAVRNYNVHAIICIGVLIKGETFHFEYISSAVSQGIMNVSLELELPIIFGVLTLSDEKQAEERLVLANTWADGAVSMITSFYP